MRKLLLGCLLIIGIHVLHGQEYFPTNKSVSTTNENYTAFTNAEIHVNPTELIKGGTLLIKDGKIVKAGKNIDVPANAIVIDLKGKHIYPSFIDMYSDFGMEKSKRNYAKSSGPQYDAGRKGYYWNDHILTDQRGIEDFKFDQKKSKAYIDAGFGVVNTHQMNGIMRGTGLITTLNNHAGNETRILDTDATQHISFTKSKTSKQMYPTSTMGAMALIRQVYFDAQWYASGNSKTSDLALEALLNNKNLPIVFEANSLDNDLRGIKIAKEFGLDYIIKGSGFEYEAIAAIKEANSSFIIPLNFPKPYDVSNPYVETKVSLGDMREWNQAPSNLAVLEDHNVRFALTSSDLKAKKDFREHLLKAIAYGLSEETALAALTTVPAELLGMSSEIGSLSNGSQANFLITSGNLFDKKTEFYENWIQGEKHVIKDMNVHDVTGSYDLVVNSKSYQLKISGTYPKLKSELTQDSTKIKSSISLKDDWISLFFVEDTASTTFARITGLAVDAKQWNGNGQSADGTTIRWTATKKEATKEEEKEKDKKEAELPILKPVTFPNVAFGFTELPEQETLLFKNATVWTNEADGILQNTDVLVVDGKISKIGQNLKSSKAIEIDATGKHLTTGIIDEHSHIATTSVNEAGQNSTAEVSIEDVLDADDVDIYRNLAGGVTTIQILHGSANPIGGRSALIKLKWGSTPDELLFKDAPKFIKFALGENVKQSNWGDTQTVRFPQTRMGVEQLYIDYFQRGKEYADLKNSGQPYRKDIELETLAEIINKERFITCHSYVQSEINMLMKVAEQFNFNINTFTHILEGYKVADKMKAHGVGGSTFSDWWAYKFEVNDAIPYNGAIMHSQGVTVAFNSDDAEMSRRLNQEAAKAVKYGGLTEEEAWKFVTLNPAKLLHIDDKVGSIKVGKHADLVLWSDNPLSIYAKVEKTIIEGITYFDLERNEALNKEVSKERNELINLMIGAKNKGMKTQTPVKKEKVHFHCDSTENL